MSGTPHQRARRIQLLQGAAVVLLCAVAPRCMPFEREVTFQDTHVDLGELSNERFALVRAVDILIFPTELYGCAALLGRNLEDGVLRGKAQSAGKPEHVRLCGGDKVGSGAPLYTLGSVAVGKKTVLVTASHLSGACSTGGDPSPEVAVPGQVVAAGCEEGTVVLGKQTPISITLFPYRAGAP